MPLNLADRVERHRYDDEQRRAAEIDRDGRELRTQDFRHQADKGQVKRADHGEALGIKGQGYVGSFLNVDIYVSSRVDAVNAGADLAGAMFASGCFAYATGTPVAVPGAVMSQPSDMLTVEISRGGSRTGTTLIIGHSYFGTALAEDARGVGIVTDA